MNKLLNFYENLPINKKIITIIILCLILYFLTHLMADSNESNKYTKGLDYRKISSESLLENYKKFDDRNTYLEIKYILESIKSDFNLKNKNYYQVLDSNYSKHISKNKFNEKFNNIFNKITNNGYKLILYSENDNLNTYIAKIIVDDEIVGNIGIILYPNSLTYSSFYIE